MTKTFKENPFNRDFFIGTRNKYLAVDGLVGVADGGEMVRDKVYIKREEKYDRKKFIKLYIENIQEIQKLKTAGMMLFWLLASEIQVGKDYVWLVWNGGYNIHRNRFSRGICELCDTGIIARSGQKGKYWVNLNVLNRG